MSIPGGVLREVLSIKVPEFFLSYTVCDLWISQEEPEDEGYALAIQHFMADVDEEADLDAWEQEHEVGQPCR